jgi:diacylglycerol kinase
MGLIVVACGLYFDIERWEWCIILLTIGVVLAFEMVNTSIENLVNLVTTEWLPLAGKIKDIAAGAVLLISSISVMVGILIFYKYFVSLF